MTVTLARQESSELEYSLWERSMSLKDDRFVQGKMPEVMRRCQLGEPAQGKRAK